MNNKKVIRSYPTALWTFAVVLTLLGIFFYFNTAGNWILPAIFFVAALVVILVSPTLTISVDNVAGLIAIQSRSLIKKSIKEYPIANIKTIEIESSTHRDLDDHTKNTSFRLVMKLNDNTVVPFQSYYSGNLLGLNHQCNQLREITGLNKSGETPQGLIQNLMGSKLQEVQEKMVEEQESITGEQDDERVTGDIHWKLETKSVGAIPISRWISKDFTLPDHFFYLTQKVKGQSDMGGFLSGLSKTLFIQSMNIYGFTDFHAPGRDSGQQLSSLDATLSPHFSGFSDSILLQNRIINPWVKDALVAWAEQNPLKQGSQDQLVLLIGPTGVYLSMLGLASQEHLDKMTVLGVEIVKSLKSGS